LHYIDVSDEFSTYFVAYLVMLVLCVYLLGLLSGFFGTRSGFCSENRLATLTWR